mgnify:CR=1 FL=1
MNRKPLGEILRASGAITEDQLARSGYTVVTTFNKRAQDAAIAAVNESRFGLQCGLFSNDLAHVRTAFDRLEVGGVIVNDVPTYRIDNMPYGGVKESGLGREGIRWSIEEATELRLLVLADPQ